MQFIHAMAMAGVEQGIPYHQSLTAARDVTESAALLLRSTNEHPQSTISKVCSPAGTTIAGIRALADHSFDRAVMAAVAAATRRSNELEQ
jgi:pyrroline-5-carboxylate reductase